MSSLENLTILEIREKLLKKEISSQEITSYYLSQIEKKDKDINAYITVCAQQALEKAKYFDNNFEKEKDKKLGGIPLAIKDAFSTKGILTTSASHILDGYIPAYESCISLIRPKSSWPANKVAELSV